PPRRAHRMSMMSRRRFVVGTSAGLAGILASRTAPAVGQTREISYLCWNNFAPASDKKLDEIGQRFTKESGKAIPSGYEGGHVKGVWRAVPQYHGMFRRHVPRGPLQEGEPQGARHV